jgi:hypothetical protein
LSRQRCLCEETTEKYTGQKWLSYDKNKFDQIQGKTSSSAMCTIQHM